MTRLLCGIFFLSGAAALVFETLWFRQAGLVLGNGVWASSLVLAGFMGGLALGNVFVARWGDRIRRPLRAYALVETLIAASGVGLVLGFPGLGRLLAAWLGPLSEHPVNLNLMRLTVAFVVLLIPSTAMGATLPLLTKSLSRVRGDFGPSLGLLYGWNTLGAVAGVVLAEAFLIRAVGLRGSALAAGAINLSVAAVVLVMARNEVRTEGSSRGSLAWPGRRSTRWLVAAFGAGFALLSLEVVWFRFLALYVTGSALALGLMLAIVLSGIGIGGVVAARWLRHDPNAHRLAPLVVFAAGMLCVASYGAFPAIVPDDGVVVISSPLAILRVSVPLIGPVALASGIFFTFVGAGLRRELPTAISTTGWLTFANTLGATLGSLVAGFLLLPGVGMEGSLFLLALTYGLVALTVWPSSASLGRGAALAAGAGLALALCLFPFGAMLSRHVTTVATRWAPDGRVELVSEGLTETVVYLERLFGDVHHSHRLVTNSYSMSATNNRSRRYMKLFVYLPVALHPEPREALLISFGVGSTARALTDTSELETIDVVDLSRGILDASRIVFPADTDNPLDDERVRVHVEDGRYFLQTTKRSFDIITAEPPPPGQAGVVNLYSREYFALLRDRLAEGGIATYWLPMHSLPEDGARAIMRGFADVFEDCSLWHGAGPDLMLMGSRNARGPTTAEQFARQWRDPVVAAELREVGFEQPEQLAALFIGDARFIDEQTRGVRPLVDDFPMRAHYPVREPGTFEPWGASDAALRRFQESPLIRHLLPATVRDATTPFFRYQQLINDAFFKVRLDLDSEIDGLHDVLTTTDLRMPIIWLLRSDSEAQRALGAMDAATRLQSLYQFHVGAGHLADRDYDAAIDAFERAEPSRSHGVVALRLRALSLCLAGREDEARALTTRVDAVRGGAPMDGFWVWMAEAFGVGPTNTQPSQSAAATATEP